MHIRSLKIVLNDRHTHQSHVQSPCRSPCQGSPHWETCHGGGTGHLKTHWLGVAAWQLKLCWLPSLQLEKYEVWEHGWQDDLSSCSDLRYWALIFFGSILCIYIFYCYLHTRWICNSINNGLCKGISKQLQTVCNAISNGQTDRYEGTVVSFTVSYAGANHGWTHILTLVQEISACHLHMNRQDVSCKVWQKTRLRYHNNICYILESKLSPAIHQCIKKGYNHKSHQCQVSAYEHNVIFDKYR